MLIFKVFITLENYLNMNIEPKTTINQTSSCFECNKNFYFKELVKCSKLGCNQSNFESNQISQSEELKSFEFKNNLKNKENE